VTVRTTPNPERSELDLARQALRKLAADPRCRAAFEPAESLLRKLIGPAARRYVAAADQDAVLEQVAVVVGKGYRVTVEAVGEDITDPFQIEAVVDGYVTLLKKSPQPLQLGFDLSNVGLLVSADLARANTLRIVDAATAYGGNVMISMERSALTNDILTVFFDVAQQHANVGITLQAHLHRTDHDLDRAVALHRKIRLVKGAYALPAGVGLSRGPELDDRFLRLAERAVAGGVPLALATHDAGLLQRAAATGLLDRAEEIEMLHGVRPALLREYAHRGHPCRVYLTYGENWWLHLLHRLAEFPPTVVTALADLADPDERVFASEY
jgi:proline dehydrogenase